MTQFRKISTSACLAAALSMTAAPALAVEAPANAATPTTSLPGVVHWDGDAFNAERHRRNRHRRNRVDAGDIIGGILVIGAIAAIADAASKPRTERRYPDQQPRYREGRSSNSSQGASGLDRAVNMCLTEIERDTRVENVDSVDRSGNGWNVTGTIYNGDSFACQIDNNGKVSNISFGGRVAVTQDRQYDDARYYEARRRSDNGEIYTTQVDDQPSGQQPAYPGGPVDGDLEYDEEYGG